MPPSKTDPVYEKFDELNTKHPDYRAWESTWRLYRDVLGDYQADLSAYLVKGRQENPSIFALRQALTQFVPDSCLCVAKILGALFKVQPYLDLGAWEDRLKPFTEDADMRGHSIEEVRKRWAHALLGYGSPRMLVNLSSPPIAELVRARGVTLTAAQSDEIAAGNQPKLTLDQEKKGGVRPFVVTYSPLSVIDWDHGNDFRLSMVRIKEQRRQKSVNGRKWYATVTTFIEYDRENVSWWQFIEDDKDGRLQGNVDPVVRPHRLGLVPMVTECFPEELTPMIGNGFLRFSARADIRKMLAESDLHYDAYIHAHPGLKIWARKDLASYGVGTNSVHKFPPKSTQDGVEDAEYIQLPQSASDILHKIIDLNKVAIQQHTGIDPLGILQPGSNAFQATGIARAYSFDTSEGRILTAAADCMQKIEKKILEIAARYVDPQDDVPPEESVFDGSVNYPESFDTAALGDLIDTAAKICSTTINSETMARLLHKRIAAQILGEQKREDVETVEEEIDEGPILGSAIGKTKSPTDMPDFSSPEEAFDADGNPIPPPQAPGNPKTNNVVSAGSGSGDSSLPASSTSAKAGVRNRNNNPRGGPRGKPIAQRQRGK